MSEADAESTPPTPPTVTAPVPTILREPTVLLATVTAAAYILGQVYLIGFYGTWGLALSSLDLPTTEVLFAAGIFALPLLSVVYSTPASQWLSDRLPEPRLDAPEEEFEKWITKAKWFLLMLGLPLIAFLGYMALTGKAVLLIGLTMASVCFIGIRPFRAVSAREVLSSLYRCIGLFFSLLVAAYGMGLGVGSGYRGTSVTLYTTNETNWSGSGKPMRLILHRGEYWYVTPPEANAAQIIPDSAVIRAEQTPP